MANAVDKPLLLVEVAPQAIPKSLARVTSLIQKRSIGTE